MQKLQLAAIMFTDIVGYTALMQADRQKAMKAVKLHEQILKDRLVIHGGELVQTYGDGTLSIFPSASGAVQCAREIQLALHPHVPLRIGLHIGEVTRDGEHIFGDGVNIASRIESMGMSGSVLISKELQDKVQNVPGLEFASMGSFHFKNVAEKMEVFALVDENLILPKRQELKGKVKTSSRSKHWPIWVSALVGLLLIAVYLLSLPFSFTPEPETETDRITVLDFESQTPDSTFASFGKLASTYITQGLMETAEDVEIIGLANIQPQLAEAGSRKTNPQNFNTELARLTGINILVQGNYFLLDETLILNAQILKVEDQQVIKAFEVKGPRKDYQELLESLAQQILGFWAVRDQEYFAANPPTYEAYRLYEKGNELTIMDPAKSAALFEQALKEDSSFVDPLFKLYNHYHMEGDPVKKARIVARIEAKKTAFTTWQKFTYNQMLEFERQNWLEGAKQAEKAFRIDPSNMTMGYRAASMYGYVNRPFKALEILESIEDRFADSRAPLQIMWGYATSAFLYAQAGQYTDAIAVANSYPLPKTPDALAVIHMHSLIRMDSIDRLDEVLGSYLQKGLYATNGKETAPEITLTYICDVLSLEDKQVALARYINQLAEVSNSRATDDPTYYWAKGFVFFHQDKYKEALDWWQQGSINTPDWPGWLQFSLQIDYQSRIGYCMAMLGDSTGAREQIKAIQKHKSPNKTLPNLQAYYEARIYAALGETEQACKSLNEAVQKGFSFFRPTVFTIDPLLKPLHNVPCYESLVKPQF